DQGPRTKDQGPRTKDQGQRTKDKGQRTKDKGQRTKAKGQRTMTRLAEMHCVPCHKGSEPMTDEEIQAELSSLPDWDLIKVDGVPRLRRCYKTKKFADALTL